MKFLLDAQLPRRACDSFRIAGFEAIHTLDLPNGNRTSDREISEHADQHGYVVVTKDDDFLGTHLIKHQPARLLMVLTGNCSNQDLASLLHEHLPKLRDIVPEPTLLELNRDGLFIRD